MASPAYVHYIAGEGQSVTAQTLQPIVLLLSYLQKGFNALPGSAVLIRRANFILMAPGLG